MESRWVIWILVGPVLEQERAGEGSASGREEAHFIEETGTQGFYPCSLMAVGVIKITSRGPFQGGFKGRGSIGPL
jgi:hypothetical protein